MVCQDAVMAVWLTDEEFDLVSTALRLAVEAESTLEIGESLGAEMDAWDVLKDLDVESRRFSGGTVPG